MLIYSVGVSVDGYINDRNGDFNWTAPDEETFREHLHQVGELGAYLLGRRLYEGMRIWETDPSFAGAGEDKAAFAEVWKALPKVVFSRTLDRVEGNARLATGSVEEEVAAVLEATDMPVQIGGAELAGAAFERGLIDELRIFRHPFVVGGGTRHLPPVTADVALELAETRTFGGGVIYTRYTRVG